MSTQYWVAKYVEDPMRNETRNVGIFVNHNGIKAARFLGERDDGVFDARKLGSKFIFPNVYAQWRSFWRAEMNAVELSKLAEISASNFSVQYGGEVSDVGADTADEVCTFLFNLLVGGGAIDAYQWTIDEDGNVALATEITATLSHLELLARDSQLFVRHPIVTERPVRGQHVTHTPSFSQRNGRLYVFDHIDLGGSRPNKIRERAGFMGYMFSDIRAAENDALTYSLIRPSGDHPADVIDYAKNVLGSESTIVNWLDDGERNAFLEERKQVANAA
jgi:hypothetical protein